MVMPGSLDNMMMTMAGGQKLSKEDIQAVKEIRNVDVALGGENPIQEPTKRAAFAAGRRVAARN